MTQYQSLITLVPRNSYTPNNLCHETKNCAIPSLRRDSLLAKVPGPCPALTSGNTNALYCRAVMVNDPLCAIENFKVTNHRYSVFQLDFWLNHKNGYIIESIHLLKTRNDEINYSLRHFQLFYNI